MSSAFDGFPLKKRADGEYGEDVEARASAWMTRAKQGDEAAFDALTRALGERALRLAQGWVGSREDALELAQEAFLKTYRARDTFRDGEPFLPWFHRILRNTCYSFLRGKKRLTPRSLSAPEEGESDWDIADDETTDPGTALEQSERAQVFWTAFKKLSARDREILALRHFEELPYADIARALEIPEGTVMSRLFHARARLRRALEGKLDLDGGTA